MEEFRKKFRRRHSENEYQDLGLNSKVDSNAGRYVNRDGSFNVEREGVNIFRKFNIYHELITMSWRRFIFYVLWFYILANTLFALLYCSLGEDALAGHHCNSWIEHFWEAFFFSSQTITTVGYGHIHPNGAWANTIAAIESMAGLLGFALATGLLYGKFSRPVAKIVYSKEAIIAPYKEINGLMFRMANARKNQLIEVEVQVVISRIENTEKNTRAFHTLSLERTKINFFPTSWTIVHPIDEDSPLYGVSAEQFNASQAEILVLVKAFDDTFSQTVFARSSYTYKEVSWGAKFIPVISEHQTQAGRLIFHVHKLSDYNKAELNSY